VVIEDGAAARYGLGVFVPALLVGVFFPIIWPAPPGHMRFDLGAYMFIITALVLALLKPPRTTEFDPERREARLTIGWPPLLGRRRTISFDDISDAKVWRLIKLDDLGHARPALVLKSGKTVFLSTYGRSPKRCREIIEQIRRQLGLGSGTGLA